MSGCQNVIYLSVKKKQENYSLPCNHYMSNKKSEGGDSSLDDGEQLFDKPVQETNENGEVFWELGNRKRVTISSFKGKTYINIREFYEKDGKMLPSTKGISLPVEQWNNLKLVVKDIDNELDKVDGSKGNKKVKRS